MNWNDELGIWTALHTPIGQVWREGGGRWCFPSSPEQFFTAPHQPSPALICYRGLLHNCCSSVLRDSSAVRKVGEGALSAFSESGWDLCADGSVQHSLFMESTRNEEGSKTHQVKSTQLHPALCSPWGTRQRESFSWPLVRYMLLDPSQIFIR